MSKLVIEVLLLMRLAISEAPLQPMLLPVKQVKKKKIFTSIQIKCRLPLTSTSSTASLDKSALTIVFVPT